MYQYVNTERQHLAWSVGMNAWVSRREATIFYAPERWTANVPEGGVFKRAKGYR